MTLKLIVMKTQYNKGPREWENLLAKDCTKVL